MRSAHGLAIAAKPIAAGVSAAEPVFRARGLSKIYRMGEIEVPALQAVDLDLYAQVMREALDAGRRRAESIAQTDLQLAHTHTARSYLDEARARTARRREAWKALPPRERRNTPRPTTGSAGTVVGYRRVLSNRPNHCALCVLASTQRYHRENLMPIHPGCGCTVAPVFSTDDRSDQLVLDPSLAQEVDNIIRRDLGEDYLDRNRSKSKGGRSGPDLYKDIVVTNDHGELGPVLGVRGHHFERDPGRPGHLGHIRVNPKPEAEPDFPDLDVPAQALRSVNAS